MNKTVTINISGIIFHIEEDAFEILNTYLQRLRDQFSREEGRDEIMADIEARIAELLKARTSSFKEVVVMDDVNAVIEIMGQPEAFTDADEQTKKETSGSSGQQGNTGQGHQQGYRYRRLFRDPDDKVIGGVCSGLGHYFDINPVWIRLAFAAAFFVFGTGVLLYLILLIIMPKAATTSEKLEMKGEPVDVNNIRRTIREEFDGFRRRMEDLGQEASEWSKNQFGKSSSSTHSYRNRDQRNSVEQFFGSAFQILGRILAIALVVVGVLLTILLVTSTFSFSHIGPEVLNRNFRNLFPDGTDYTLAIIAILLVFGIPCLMMMYKGICLLLNIKRKDNIVGLTALSIWILGLILAIYIGIKTGRSFSEKGRVTEKISLATSSIDTLNIRVKIDPDMENEEYHNRWNRRYHYGRRYHAIFYDGQELKFGSQQLHIIESKADSIELVIYKYARGYDRDEATATARQIRYQLEQKGNELIFSSFFTIGEQQRWRNQELHMELRIPRGKVIYLDPTTEDLIYDIENVGNVLDHDMVDRRWLMTEKGLMCIDCSGLELEQDQKGSYESKSDSLMLSEKKLNEKIDRMADSMRRAERKK